ncbi:helicase-related protein [Lentilactobacillus otakiensis]|uniref:Helicase domain-containing protein n=1 Tax=Lentilactobacillus otakiensis DSM 19908 = JCM 15040 TaxID=1423780 RepID=S4NND2_9LACO|nr:helicase-related protein [Lentilactobacillus otakiensis]MBZ3775860.1 DEAD/DEAH box helicase family protein [Lentilactobacillus otakiensis]MDV3518250.1 helicase-related protein [Lentilactobacillus otakiensis]GAD15543.1 helicase domain-containing protein [Lentilactobacillus otakiensis DSM 19908 = JCM 15040]
MINDISELYGRQIPLRDLPENLITLPDIQSRDAISRERGLKCVRCGSRLRRKDAYLPNKQFYCYACIQMGRLDTLTPLAWLPEPNRFPSNPEPLTWDGQLTELQEECANKVVEVFQNKQRHLLWAVTGAGKTEMLFKGISWAVARGLRIGIASPRVDVCIELFPRIQSAFEKVSTVLLHGKSEQPYKYSQITICTTHQLLRFYHAFDVLIIDEVDVFPYSGNQMLHFGVSNAIKADGATLYLTATPDQALFRAISRKQLSVSYLPIRYHGHYLPEVTVIRIKNLSNQISAGTLPKQIVKMVTNLAAAKQRFLLFVPHIKDLAAVATAIKRAGVVAKFETVYSADPDRIEKVALMRSRQIDFLITTTILERGVTFPGIDVLVLKADNDIFSAAALVQIAGRVGRNRDRPTGQVLFYCENKAANIKSCDRQIKLMNRKAAKL